MRRDLVSDCSELALNAVSGQMFHDEFLRLATTAVDAAGGYLVTLHSSGVLNPASNLDDARPFAAAIAANAAAMSDRELTTAFSRTSFSTDEVFCTRRLDELELFRRYLPGLGVGQAVSSLWCDGDRVHFLALFCSKHGDFEHFRARGVAALHRVFPLLAVAERLTQQAPPTAARASQVEKLTDGCRLTATERKTMSLVVRGLTNRQIAHVLGLSPNTVRNRLAACFAKLGATRRTEAAFLMAAANQQRATSVAPPLRMFRRLTSVARLAHTRPGQ